jgi:iron complex outermembrane recepter protein
LVFTTVRVTNASVHWRIKPELQAESPELILSSGYGNGNVVYQGDNRFALRNIMFFQNRLELEKKDKYFIRLYATNENSGSSYDPYATAIKMMNDARTNGAWAQVYQKYWKDRIVPKMNALGYPGLIPNPNGPPFFIFDQVGYDHFMSLYSDSLTLWHSQVANWTNTGTAGVPGVDSPVGFYAPGTAQFTEAFNRFKSSKNNTGEGGTLFFDRSALYHGQAERTWSKTWMDKIRVGANARLYRPYSEGTIFSDSVYYNHFTNASGFADSTRMYNRITNFQYGLYAGVEKKLLADELILSATIRMDKNENFNAIFSPAASAVYMPKRNHVFRASFSSGLRNPTLTDQYLYLNVGPAILSGNLKGVNGLYTVESFKKYIEGVTLQPSVLKTFNIAPIRPEQVRSFDFGYRGTLKERWYVDASYYFSIYNHFIGYQIGVYSKLDEFNFPTNTQAYRYSANSLNTVTTQGANVGVNYYFKKHFSLNANYSWNELVKTDKDDPIIPAFNTPKNKYNLGLTAREIHIKKTKNPIGFSVNFKWIEGFLYEGSPQFTGYVPTYNMMDAQVNYKLVKYNTTFKFGGSNVLNNMKFQTYGGPRIGRLLYFSLLYEWDPKKKK